VTRPKATYENPVSNMGEVETADLGRALAELANHMADVQELLDQARAQRDRIVLELVERGFSERDIAAVAGISGVMVHKIKEAARV
jgi:DNA-binding NarL/FixJ family response regulator